MVMLFLPRDPASTRALSDVARKSANATIDMTAACAGLCRSYPEVCDAVGLASLAGREMLFSATTALAARLAKKEENPHSS